MDLRSAAGLLSLILVVSACQATTDAGSSAQPPSTVSTSQSMPASTDGSTSPTPTASARPALAVGSLVQAVVPGLRVREAPGLLGSELGTLPPDAEGLVVEGPRSADGYTWYALQAAGLRMGTGCEQPITTDPYNCPIWYGWVAANGLDGSAWLAEADLECGAWPNPNLTDEFVHRLPYLGYLACFGGEDRRVVGFYPHIPDDAGLGGACGGVPDEISWLACNLGYEFLVADRADGYFGSPFILTVPADMAMPARGQWVEVTGHFDDPAAQRCDYRSPESDTPPEQSVGLCRGRFVVTAAQPAAR